MSQVSYSELSGIVDVFLAELARYPGVQNVQTDLRLNTPELRVQVDRAKLADVGVDVSRVGRTLESMLGGRQVTRYKESGEQYDVLVQVVPRDRSRPNDISDIYVRARSGEMVQLANVLNVREGVSPQTLNHFNRLRSVTISAAPAPGYSLGEALKEMNTIAARVLPLQAQTDLDGQSREFRDSAGSIYLVFGMAIAFIYLVLAAQFESWRNPLIIMLSVPLSLTGALLALWLTGGTLSIYSQIGLITLVGLITKHGILIVEFANQLRDEGHALVDAVVDASVMRLRPILMTTGAMVLGAVPLALATGAGAESRVQIGWVIVGGMSLGTLLTLFVVPCVYTLIAGARNKPVPLGVDSHAPEHGRTPGQVADAGVGGLSGSSVHQQLGIAARLAAFQHIAAARRIGIDAAVHDLPVLNAEQKAVFVLHRKSRLGLCTRHDGHDDVLTADQDRARVIVEVLVFLAQVRPERLEFLFAVIGAAIGQRVRKFKDHVIRHGPGQIGAIVPVKAGECFGAGAFEFCFSHGVSSPLSVVLGAYAPFWVEKNAD